MGIKSINQTSVIAFCIFKYLLVVSLDLARAFTSFQTENGAVKVCVIATDADGRTDGWCWLAEQNVLSQPVSEFGSHRGKKSIKGKFPALNTQSMKARENSQSVKWIKRRIYRRPIIPQSKANKGAAEWKYIQTTRPGEEIIRQPYSNSTQLHRTTTGHRP